jgi:hypothetical protein
MRYMKGSMLASALLTGAALAGNPTLGRSTEAANAPDANLELTAGAVAAGIGYTWGHGEITYQGASHKFSISGISVVDVGIVNMSATGNVYHLTKLEDLSGNYVAASAGLTIAGGGDAIVLKNEHGVVIKLLSTDQGLRFNLAGSGMSVRLES